MTTVSPPVDPPPPVRPPDPRSWSTPPPPAPSGSTRIPAGTSGPVTPTHAGPALIGALAVLAGMLAIPPMISGSGWFWPTAEVVLVIWLVGVGARLARVPAAGVVALQLAAALIALTALFTVGGYAGVIPNTAVLDEAGELLTGAWTQIRTTVSPAPSSTELAFLICVTVSTTALIVDMLITLCRAPALVALPLLCVYAVPASINVDTLPVEAFAAPAVLYAMLLVADRLSGRRTGSDAGAAEIATGLLLACVATVVALLVADNVTGVGTAGRLPRTDSASSAGVGLSPFTSLAGSLQQSTPVDLFRVSGLPEPGYLRTVGLQRWTPNEGFSIDQLDDGALPDQPTGLGHTPVTVIPLNYRDQYLPIYNGVETIGELDPGWSFDSALESVHRPDPIAPSPYLVTATFARPSADELRADTATAGGELIDTGDLSPEVIARAVEVTAGATTTFDKVDRLLEYFTTPANGFTYSLDVPVGNSGDRLVDFLDAKQGYCEQYASAMAVMLRSIGVPARVAVGFTQGVRNADGDYVITSHDAHAWVEVPFDRAGWVQFDPTPLGGGQGGEQGFVESTAQSTATDATAATPTPTLAGEDPGANEIPTAVATSTSASGSAAAADGGPRMPPAVWWVLAALALLAGLVAGPSVVRRRRRTRRLAIADAGGPDAAAAAWREIEDLAIDHSVTLDPSQSARACANRLAKAAHLSPDGRGQLRVLVSAAEHGWYAGGSDAGTGDAADIRLGDAPRTMAVELAHSAPLGLIERLLPRSVRPRWWRD